MTSEILRECSCGEKVTVNGGAVHKLLSKEEHHDYVRAFLSLRKRGYLSYPEIYYAFSLLREHGNQYAIVYPFNPKNFDTESNLAVLFHAIDVPRVYSQIRKKFSRNELEILTTTVVLLLDCLRTIRDYRNQIKRA